MCGNVGHRGSSVGILGVVGEAGRVATLDQVGGAVGATERRPRARNGETGLAVVARGRVGWLLLLVVLLLLLGWRV